MERFSYTMGPEPRSGVAGLHEPLLHTLQGLLPMPVQVLHWFSLIWLLNVPAPLPQPPLGFDQSLDLERQRVITPQERLGFETGRVGVPFDPTIDRRLVVMDRCPERSVRRA